MLYQPIIGSNATSLFFTLMMDLDKSEFNFDFDFPKAFFKELHEFIDTHSKEDNDKLIKILNDIAIDKNFSEQLMKNKELIYFKLSQI